MGMDKSWMNRNRLTKDYEKGLDQFLDMAFDRVVLTGKILCPCKSCKNANWVNRETGKLHLTVEGFMSGYTHWIAHGEETNKFNLHPSLDEFDMLDEMSDLVHEALGVSENDELDEEPNEQANVFYKLLEDEQKELYPGCKKFSKLKFIVRLFHLKCMGRWSDKSFTMLLELLKEAFPDLTESVPKSYYEVKKVIGGLGLTCVKIHACPNDCMLYWKEHEDKIHCHLCGASRYIETDNDSLGEENSSFKKVSGKVLRYFPLIPRLQRLFMSSKTASYMTWHKEEGIKDGKLRHPSDATHWKAFDCQHKDIAEEPRNIRLGLAAHGFSPFKTMSTSHSTWPVILTPYNMPPWMCMKEPFFFLTLLIPGPSAPGNNIDVYLRPAVDDLKILWLGVWTYDAFRKQNFKMRGALLWTINDFPAYANLSGWSTKGKLACPSCHKDTTSKYLRNSRKMCYLGHRKFLKRHHPYRRNAKSFDGNKEFGKAPIVLTGDMILEELEGYNFRFGKKVVDNPNLPYNWKKKSIFHELVYWKDNILRHNLDVMHTEKNWCDSAIGTMMNLEGKTKDNLNSRLDLVDMGIRPELHPVTLESGKKYLPPACYSMNKNEIEIFREILQNVKVPDGYASNISKRVQAKPFKLTGLKSHDNHILMQQLMPIALRKLLPKHVRKPIIKICSFYRELCSKVLNTDDLLRMEEDIVKTLCELEKIFPPSFFDVMIHLPTHLAYEARMGGPVQYRWMYAIERYLFTLKSYVRNPSRPEGSIEEAYLVDECLTFCSRYLDDVETKFNKIGRNDDIGPSTITEFPVFSNPGRPIGSDKSVVLDENKCSKAHQKHKKMVEDENPRLRKKDIERLHSESFARWFYNHVENQFISGNEVSEELRALARGPNPVGKRYRGFIINGFRFHVKEYELRRKTQNSGVSLTAKTSSFSSRNDKNPIVGDVTYYGVLKDIIELDCFGDRKIVLFYCDWISTSSAQKVDEYGFTSVDFSRLRKHEEPCILASQAQQVFYVEDTLEKGWHVVVNTKARDSFDMDPVLNLDANIIRTEDDGNDESEELNLVREDMEGVEV